MNDPPYLNSIVKVNFAPDLDFAGLSLFLPVGVIIARGKLQVLTEFCPSSVGTDAGLALVTFAYPQHASNFLTDHHIPLGGNSCVCCRGTRHTAPLIKGQRVHASRCILASSHPSPLSPPPLAPNSSPLTGLFIPLLDSFVTYDLGLQQRDHGSNIIIDTQSRP